MSETITTEVRLPKQTIDEVKAIAKLAGLSPESVIKLALATEVRRWQKVGADAAEHRVGLMPGENHDRRERQTRLHQQRLDAQIL